MVVPRSLFQLLVEALQDSRPGMAPDDPAEIARRYPQNGASDSSNAEAQTRFPPPVDVPRRDPNFRQLSRAPFAAQAEVSGKSNIQPSSSDHLWAAQLQNEGSAGAHGHGPTLPWWTPMLPVPGGRLALPRAGGMAGPMPLPGPTTAPKIPMPMIPEVWKAFGAASMLPQILLLEHLLGETGETNDGDTAAAQLLELFRKTYSGGGGGRGRGRDRAKEDGEDDNVCDKRRYAEDARCYRQFPKSLSGCLENSEIRKNQCYANGRIPAPNERRLWNRADEERWFNQLR